MKQMEKGLGTTSLLLICNLRRTRPVLTRGAQVRLAPLPHSLSKQPDARIQIAGPHGLTGSDLHISGSFRAVGGAPDLSVPT